MDGKFVASEARVLCYGKELNYFVTECNNKKQLEYAIVNYGMPNVFMTGFKNWREVQRAKACYQWELSAFPHTYQSVKKPSDDDLRWFWEKKLEGEYVVRIDEIVSKWDDKLPDKHKA